LAYTQTCLPATMPTPNVTLTEPWSKLGLRCEILLYTCIIYNVSEPTFETQGYLH